MRKLFTTMAVLAVLVMGSAMAQAGVLVESWEYSISGIFVDWENDIGCSSGIYTSGATSVNGVNGVRSLSWGGSDYNQRSVLSISSAESGVVDTNGPAALGLTLSHINKAVGAAGRTLSDCDLYLAIDLKPVINGAVNHDVSVTVLFDFFETPNDGLLADDIFIITNPANTVQNFMFDGQEYTFSFLASFDYLPETNPEYYSAYINNPEHVYGWVTREGRTSCITTYLEITAAEQPVPEPATVLLMGAGLAGLAFVNRRRQK